MQIAFWSQELYGCGVSGNIIAVAYMSAVQYAFRAIIMQSNFSCPNLDFALIPQNKRISVHEEFSYFYDSGIDAILNKLFFHKEIDEPMEYLEKMQKETIMDNVLELKANLLYYLPGTYKNNKEVYEFNLYSHMNKLFQIMNKVSDITFVQCDSNESIVSNKLLKEVDLLVVNLPQNPAHFTQFFDSNHFPSEKIVYLIGQYNEESKYHRSNIRRKFHIKKEDLGVIPYNVDFMDSLIGGKTIEFLERNIDCRKEDYNYYFMQELRRSTNMILKKVGFDVS